MLYLEKLFSRVSEFFMWIAGAATVLILLLTISNMVLRVIYRPFGSIVEVVSFLSAISISLALGYSQLKKVHVTIDILFERFPKKLQKATDVAVYLFCFLMFAIITWQLFLYAGRLYKTLSIADNLRIPIYPLVYLLASGFGVLSTMLIIDVYKVLRGDFKK